MLSKSAIVYRIADVSVLIRDLSENWRELLKEFDNVCKW